MLQPAVQEASHTDGTVNMLFPTSTNMKHICSSEQEAPVHFPTSVRSTHVGVSIIVWTFNEQIKHSLDSNQAQP